MHQMPGISQESKSIISRVPLPKRCLVDARCGELRSVCNGFDAKSHKINVADESLENGVFSEQCPP